MLDINGWELVVLLVVAVVILGPERLPGYAAKLRGWIRQARSMADTARSQLREQVGPDFDDIDWRQYDPRQYDPRRIVREALFDDDEVAEPGWSDDGAPVDRDAASDQPGSAKPTSGARRDPTLPTPYDADAT